MNNLQPRNFALSDIHGQGKLWEQVKNYLQKNDTLYFLGDAVDKGPDGISILKDMIKMPNVNIIKGNHEDMLEYYGNCYLKNDFSILKLWKDKDNGGEETMNEFLNMSLGEQLWLLDKIHDLPHSEWYIEKDKYGNIKKKVFMCHAGTDPLYTDEQALDKMLGRDSFLWNRECLYNPWPVDKKYEKTFIVHGHTPVPYFSYLVGLNFPNKINTGVMQYADGHKYNIDLGSFNTKICVLLDLDTLEPIYIGEHGVISNIEEYDYGTEDIGQTEQGVSDSVIYIWQQSGNRFIRSRKS